MTKLIVANWKSNKTLEEVKSWWDTFSATPFQQKDIHVVICPPFVYTYLLFVFINGKKFPFPVTIGVQDISQFPGGAYTGAVSAHMLRGITHAIVGHTERRRWFHETPQEIARKAELAVESHITPIVSVDRDNVHVQLAQFAESLFPKMLIMYEPKEAISEQIGPIGKGKSADSKDVEEMAEVIKKLAPGSPMLYGGSIKAANAKQFFTAQHLHGVVVGSASTNAQEFINIINES